MSAKHLASGSECPPFKDNKLRLYAMHYCPFCERAELVLEEKQIPHEIVNINLSNKPEWFLKKNPAGSVPVLEHADGRIITDSTIICEYLDAIKPENPLLPSDPYQKARQKMMIEHFSKVPGVASKIFRNNDSNANEELNKELEYFEKSLENDFFGGDKVGMIDFIIWPWFERMPVMKEKTNYNLDSSKFPKLNAWVKRMQEQSSVKKIMHSPASLSKFFKGYPSNVDYEFEL